MLYTLKMTLSGSQSPPGHCPWTPRSLALRFIGFTHSACHYYSQLFSTTQIGLATTLLLIHWNSTSFQIISDFFSQMFSHPCIAPPPPINKDQSAPPPTPFHLFCSFSVLFIITLVLDTAGRETTLDPFFHRGRTLNMFFFLLRLNSLYRVAQKECNNCNR